MSEKKTVLANSFYYTFSSLLIKAFGFFLLPLYTAYLSPNDYGITNLIHSFLSVSTFLVSFSLYSAIPRFYVEYKDQRDKLKLLISLPSRVLPVYWAGTSQRDPLSSSSQPFTPGSPRISVFRS
jgi:O-antigen/teichoic acid export membrane protein